MMSKERELLNRCAVTLKARDICPLLLKEISELLAQTEQWQPECCICKTTENVEWVGCYQAYRCDSEDCIPF